LENPVFLTALIGAKPHGHGHPFWRVRRFGMAINWLRHHWLAGTTAGRRTSSIRKIIFSRPFYRIELSGLFLILDEWLHYTFAAN
jgi:hypothetical protein